MQQKQCYEFVHGLKAIPDQALALACAVPAQTGRELQDKLTGMSTATVARPERNDRSPAG
jgi:hypothetical protein